MGGETNQSRTAQCSRRAACPVPLAELGVRIRHELSNVQPGPDLYGLHGHVIAVKRAWQSSAACITRIASLAFSSARFTTATVSPSFPEMVTNPSLACLICRSLLKRG